MGIGTALGIGLVGLLALLRFRGWALERLRRRWGRGDRARATLRAVGRRLHLRPTADGGSAYGQIGGQPLSVTWVGAAEPDPHPETGPRYELRSPSRLPPGWTFSAESPLTRLRTTLGAADVTLGVPDFDARVRVEGPGPHTELLSRLPAAARDAIARLTLRATLVTRRGELVALRPASDEPEVFPLAALARELAALAALCDDDRPAAERLADHLERDPDPAYRRACFDLATALPATPGARDAVRAGLTHRDPAIRVAAARLAHDDAGARVLSELLEQRDTSPTTRAAALTALAELERPPDLAELREHACAQDAAVRAAAARCLGHLPGPAVVATLRRLLDDPSPEVQAAALEALGACAPLSMAPDLAAVALATRRDGRVRRAAREAMARLQARTGAAPGQLALLPEPAQGALSFPEALADAVALATADRALPRTPAPADAREYAAAQRGTAVSAADAPHSSSRTIAPEASFAPLTSSPASAADAPLATSSAITPEASAAPLDQR